MKLTEVLQDAIRQNIPHVAYGIIHGLNTGQIQPTDDFQQLFEDGVFHRNIEEIKKLVSENPFQIGLVKLYAVPSMANKPALNLYFARNPYEVKQLHMKQPEYEKGKSRIYDISHWSSLEVKLQHNDTTIRLEDLRDSAQNLPIFVGTLAEGLINEDGMQIDFTEKERQTAV